MQTHLLKSKVFAVLFCSSHALLPLWCMNMWGSAARLFYSRNSGCNLSVSASHAQAHELYLTFSITTMSPFMIPRIWLFLLLHYLRLNKTYLYPSICAPKHKIRSLRHDCRITKPFQSNSIWSAFGKAHLLYTVNGRPEHLYMASRLLPFRSQRCCHRQIGHFFDSSPAPSSRFIFANSNQHRNVSRSASPPPWRPASVLDEYADQSVRAIIETSANNS